MPTCIRYGSPHSLPGLPPENSRKDASLSGDIFAESLTENALISPGRPQAAAVFF